MGCLLTSGYAATCETKKKKNGLKGDVYLFNLFDANGVKLAFTETGYTISDITVQSGSGFQHGRSKRRIQQKRYEGYQPAGGRKRTSTYHQN